MSMCQRLTELADRLLRGENGGVLKELPGLCSGFFWSVRSKFRFFDIPLEQVRGAMLDDAFQAAFAEYQRTRYRFPQCLQNAFRKCCREYRRARQVQSIRELSELSRARLISLIAKDDRGTENSPAERAACRELLRVVISLLHQEDRLCQRIMLMWARGSSDQEIGNYVGRDARECKNTRWRNIRTVQRALPTT